MEGRLKLYGRIDAPSVVPKQYVDLCKTYRQAVRMCWQLRRVDYMTQQQLAGETGIRAQLVSDYLNPDDRPDRRDLKAEDIAPFEAACGNTLVSQWIAARSVLTVAEESIATARAAA